MDVIIKDVAERAVVHCPFHMFWGDEHLVVVVGLLACQVQDVGRQVLQNASEENRCAPAHAMGVGTFSQEAIDAANGELQLGSCGTGEDALLTPTRGMVSSFPRHCFLPFAPPQLDQLDYLAGLGLSRYQCLSCCILMLQPLIGQEAAL